MGDVNEVAGVSMRDVSSAMDAVHDDQGAIVRIVIFVAEPANGKKHLRVVAQACDAQGAPVPGLPSVAHPWPHSEFKTLTQCFYHLVCRVYDMLEYHRYLGAQEARDAKDKTAGA